MNAICIPSCMVRVIRSANPIIRVGLITGWPIIAMTMAEGKQHLMFGVLLISQDSSIRTSHDDLNVDLYSNLPMELIKCKR